MPMKTQLDTLEMVVLLAKKTYELNMKWKSLEYGRVLPTTDDYLVWFIKALIEETDK
jgi:hypothetical protein